MKLIRTLVVNQIARQLIDERVMLSLASPGAAEFTVAVDDDAIRPNQLVTLDLGYSGQNALQRWFVGFVDRVVLMSNQRNKVFCRELSAGLFHPLPLNLRHVDVREVVTEINSVTGLNFSVPAVAYSNKKIANFYNLGNGYQAMTAIGRAFDIDDYIWQQQAGVVYVGSWQDSRWALIKNMMLPRSLFNQHSAQNTAKVAAMPALRPGMRVNGQRITKIEFQKNHMVLQWI